MGHATRAAVGEERVRGSGGTHGPPLVSPRAPRGALSLPAASDVSRAPTFSTRPAGPLIRVRASASPSITRDILQFLARFSVKRSRTWLPQNASFVVIL